MSARATGLLSPLTRARLMSEQAQFQPWTTVSPQWSDENNDFTPSPRSGYSDRSPDVGYTRMTSPYFEYTTSRRHTQRVMDGIISPRESPFDTFTFVEDTFNDEVEYYSEFTTDHYISERFSQNAVYDEVTRITTQVLGRYSDENTFGTFYPCGQDSPWNYPYDVYPSSPDPGSRSNRPSLSILPVGELAPTLTPRPGKPFRFQGGVSNNVLPINQCWGTSNTRSGPLFLRNQPLTITEISPSPSPSPRDTGAVRTIGVISPISEYEGSPRLPDKNIQHSPRIATQRKDIPIKFTRLGRVGIMDTIVEETEPSLVSSLSSISIVSSKEKFEMKDLIDKNTDCNTSMCEETEVTNTNVHEGKFDSSNTQKKLTDISTVCNLYEEMGVGYPRKKSTEKATNCNFYEEEGKVLGLRKQMTDKFTHCNFYEEGETKTSKSGNLANLRNSDCTKVTTARLKEKKKHHKAVKYNRKEKNAIPENPTVLPPLKGVTRQINNNRRPHAAGSRVDGMDVFNSYASPPSDKNALVEEWLNSLHEDKRLNPRQQSDSHISEENLRPKKNIEVLPDIPRQSVSRPSEAYYNPRRSSSVNKSDGAGNLPKLPPIRSTSTNTKPKSTLAQSPFLPSPPSAERRKPRPGRHAKAALKPEWKF